MKDAPDAKVEDGRYRSGHFRSQTGELHGAFNIPGPCGERLVILSSGKDSKFGWEHVSVSIKRRVPNWQEMTFVKELFWRDDEVVMQLHVTKASHINLHPNCLHLWRPIDAAIPLPPKELV